MTINTSHANIAGGITNDVLDILDSPIVDPENDVFGYYD
jgi:hypothetical protein